MRTVITTVGTSLLTNRDGRPWGGWRTGQPLPEADSIRQWLGTADPIRASAEIHTWHKLGLFTEPMRERVVIVHSQTADGAFCGARLAEYAASRGIKAESRQISELTYADSATFNRGLGRMVRLLAEAIREGRRSGEVAIAATGGFKAEIAIANLVGALLGAPVYYIYEQFEQLIKLEPLPVALEPDWLRQGAGNSLLQTLSKESCLPRESVSSLIKADGRLELLLEAVEEEGREIVALNVLGELAAQLLQSPVSQWPSACDDEPAEKIQLEGAGHHRPSGWEEAVDRLARSQFVKRIRYDRGAGIQAGIRPAADNPTDLYAVIKGDDAVLSLRVETTAENAEQRRLVLDHLRKLWK
jgi:putative CRISPR-associated protein (TIGR02619 family)